MDYKMPTITSAHRGLSLPATARWLTHDGAPRVEGCSPKLLDEELFLAQPIRQGNRYRQMRNYHGLYFFSQTNDHVWHESLLEASTLRWLDMHKEIVNIAAQPFELVFANGAKHTPDYIAAHTDATQVVYDVKPARYIVTEEFQLQAAQTRAVCDAVGWGYEVFGELPKQVETNLNWVSAFKHRGYYPGDAVANRLLDALEHPKTVLEAATALGMHTLADARSVLYHLIWTGFASVDLTQRLNDSAVVERGRRARA